MCTKIRLVVFTAVSDKQTNRQTNKRRVKHHLIDRSNENIKLGKTLVYIKLRRNAINET